jgi:hypothetical protein
MESPGQLQLAPWDPATNYQGAVKAASLLPNRPAAQQRQLGARRVRHVPVRNLRHRDLPAHRGRCRRLARPATATCNFVQDNPISGLPAMTVPAQAAWIVPRSQPGS